MKNPDGTMRSFVTSATAGDLHEIVKMVDAAIGVILTRGEIVVNPRDEYSSEIVRQQVEVYGFGWNWL